MDKLTVRIARPGDAEALLAVYAPYVTNTAISFEYEVPSVEEFRRRIEQTLEKYPYILAEREGEIIGYAYANPFKARPAYAWSVETTIYISKELKSHGIGRLLYDTLETALKEQNVLNMNACIAYPTIDDEYVDKNSADFHAHMGYRLVGEFRYSGYKFGRWYNMIWMEKLIGEHKSDPKSVISFPDIRNTLKEKYGII